MMSVVTKEKLVVKRMRCHSPWDGEGKEESMLKIAEGRKWGIQMLFWSDWKPWEKAQGRTVAQSDWWLIKTNQK